MIDKSIIKTIDISSIDNVAEIHMSAFPESVFTRVGSETVRRYYTWQFEGPHDLIAIGAFREEKLIGFLFGGTFRGALIGFLRKNWLYLIFQIFCRPQLLYSRDLRETIFAGGIYLLSSKLKNKSLQSLSGGEKEKRIAGILAIAVNPENQGEGVGKSLVLQFEKLAKQKSYTEMRLSVKQDNEPAINFYKKMGWSISASENEIFIMINSLGNSGHGE